MSWLATRLRAAEEIAPAPVYADEDDYPGSCRCGARWNGERPAHCTTCHITFGGNAGFDFHRVGPYYPAGRRRCLTTEALIAKGYAPNDKGHWRIPRPPESIPRQRSS